MQVSLLLKQIPFEVERTVCSKLNLLFGRRPSSAPFLSGDTYRVLADHVFDETESFDPAYVLPGSVVFVSSSRLLEFCGEILPKIPFPFVLVTHQGDLNINESYRHLAEDPKVLHWFAQNCILEHPKVTPLPIGLEDGWRHNNGEVSHFRQLAKRNIPTIPRIAYGFAIGTNLEKRFACYKAMRGSKAADEIPQFLGARSYRKTVSRYMFIASPPGNGLDCHRTWEAMYMNCVPLVEDNSMNRSFKDQGLPLVLVKSWDELMDWTEQKIATLYKECIGISAKERTSLGFWKTTIRESANGRGR